MSYKISNADFFKKPLDSSDLKNESQSTPPHSETESAKATPYEQMRAGGFRLHEHTRQTVTECAEALKSIGMHNLSNEVKNVLNRVAHERFTIAVVGEFNRGKSSFLNNFLERECLPVGILPTTAIPTRIRYSPYEKMAAFDEKNQKTLERALSSDMWNGLVAQNFGETSFQGNAILGLNNAWLQECGVELMDTPGAGDLDDRRSKQLGDALLGCDGVIIAIEAPSPLSMSEKLFIEERLIARKMPYMMVIVTKLDVIRKEERAKVLRYLRSKISEWNLEIPMYVPSPVEISEDEFDSIMGMDKIRAEIERWISNPERLIQTERWVLEKTNSIMEQTISALSERVDLMKTQDAQKRDELIAKKETQLQQARLLWTSLEENMEQRTNACYDMLVEKIDQYAEAVTERLQYEARHAPNPKRWWTEDYPYRLKIELTNLATSLDAVAHRRIAEDARWYATEIERSFHAGLNFQESSVAEKEMFANFQPDSDVSLENLDYKRNAVKIGSAVLTVSGVMFFSSMGFMPIIATMGLGTMTSILSDSFFKKQLDSQREELVRVIGESLPTYIQKSMMESERRLNAVYNDILEEGKKSEKIWLETQQKTLSFDHTSTHSHPQYEMLKKQIEMLEGKKRTLESSVK